LERHRSGARATSRSDVTSLREHGPRQLIARRYGIDTRSEAIVFMHRDCPVCRAEGFSAHSRVVLNAPNGRHIVATLYQLSGDRIGVHDAALSDAAWRLLDVNEGDILTAAHPEPLESLGHVRGRIFGARINENAMHAIMRDIVESHYSELHIASFLTACATQPLDRTEIMALTRAMIDIGERLSWNSTPVVDKHSVGGLPGNRVTPIIVAIATECGLTMPKTSSRAITSPAGTADTMETLAPVALDIRTIHRVVEREGGCVVWGGAVRLSPADDILIRVERALDLDTEGQMIASILSKKVAAGATHLIIDMPVGPTAKVRSDNSAATLSAGLTAIGDAFGIKTVVVKGSGAKPIGRGIGPALEAEDVLAVLQCRENAPHDLKERAIELAGALLELSGIASTGKGKEIARQTIDTGRAWAKFQRICEAQGGMRTPPHSKHRHPLLAERPGVLNAIDNRRLARLAKLAGAPDVKAAGIELHVDLGDKLERGAPLCTLHAEAPGELAYALSFASANPDIFQIG
jgi:thymidine phosphorylase